MKKHPLQKKHIVHIIPTLTRGGAERVVVDLCNALNRKYFTVSIIVFFHQLDLADELKHDVLVHVVEKKRLLDFSFLKKLKLKLKELQPDIVHTHLSGGDIWGSRVASTLEIPVVSTEHSVYPPKGFLRTRLKKASMEYIEHHVAISQSVARFMTRTYDVADEHISIIYNGIDVVKYSDIPPITSLKKTTSMAVVGRLEKQKGHAGLIHSLIHLPKTAYTLTIVGKGSQYDALRALVISLGLRKQVNFVGELEDVRSIYKDHEIIVIPSKTEGFGLVAVEAMAAGRLVIASDIEGLSEIIDHQKNGILIDFTDKNAFAIELSQIKKNKELLKQITAQAKKDAKRFDLYIMVKQYEAVYKQLSF